MTGKTASMTAEREDFDIEPLGSAGEGYIEQVEVVNDVLQVLVTIVCFIDGA